MKPSVLFIFFFDLVKSQPIRGQHSAPKQEV